jgi:hypothetical protein
MTTSNAQPCNSSRLESCVVISPDENYWIFRSVNRRRSFSKPLFCRSAQHGE